MWLLGTESGFSGRQAINFWAIPLMPNLLFFKNHAHSEEIIFYNMASVRSSRKYLTEPKLSVLQPDGRYENLSGIKLLQMMIMMCKWCYKHVLGYLVVSRKRIEWHWGRSRRLALTGRHAEWSLHGSMC